MSYNEGANVWDALAVDLGNTAHPYDKYTYSFLLYNPGDNNAGDYSIKLSHAGGDYKVETAMGWGGQTKTWVRCTGTIEMPATYTSAGDLSFQIFSYEKLPFYVSDIYLSKTTFENTAQYQYKPTNPESAAPGEDGALPEGTATMRFISQAHTDSDVSSYGFWLVNLDKLEAGLGDTITEEDGAIAKVEKTEGFDTNKSFYVEFDNIEAKGAKKMGVYAIPWIKIGEDDVISGDAFTYGGELNATDVTTNTKTYGSAE